ncbi:MAG: hypothetical protein WDM89_07705 [Rhizomicrobium sp.]
MKLPSKGDALDWSLGPGTNGLRNEYGADYALFVFVRDSYTSTGRAIMMLGAAMFGVGHSRRHAGWFCVACRSSHRQHCLVQPHL